MDEASCVDARSRPVPVVVGDYIIENHLHRRTSRTSSFFPRRRVTMRFCLDPRPETSHPWIPTITQYKDVCSSPAKHEPHPQPPRVYSCFSASLSVCVLTSMSKLPTCPSPIPFFEPPSSSSYRHRGRQLTRVVATYH